jgi:SAM-dependent methyltransferase
MAESVVLWGAVRPRLRRLWYVFFCQRPWYYAGALLWALMSPSARRRFQANRFRRGGPQGWKENCLRAYLDGRYYSQFANSPTLTPENRERWAGPTALEYHEALLQYYSERAEEFEALHQEVLNRLTELLALESYQYVVEIGCGNGLLLERVATLAPAGSALVGIDMSAEIIAQNRRRYPHSRVQYVHGTTVQEFLQGAGPDSALVYASGTFAFFTPNELLECLRWLQKNIPRGAVIVEDSTFLEPERERASRPADGHGFRHNYGQLLLTAGLENFLSWLQPLPELGASRIVASATWGGRKARPRGQEEAEAHSGQSLTRD